MEIVIIAFLVVIVATIAYVAYAYHWLSEQKAYIQPLDLTVKHHHHKVETLVNRFMYTTMHDFDCMPLSMSMHGRSDPDNHIVRDNKHLEYIKRDYTFELACQLLENGLVEIQEREDHYGPNPFCKHVQMTVKVVRPEPDHITYAPYGGL